MCDGLRRSDEEMIAVMKMELTATIKLLNTRTQAILHTSAARTTHSVKGTVQANQPTNVPQEVKQVVVDNYMVQRLSSEVRA